MTLVSIVIPVYNVEKYLARCLESCINQTYENLEIICVNDGSTDNSLKILEQYQKLDSRIQIINKENGGLSSARNTGLKHVKGKYILFVDSDDYISTIAIEKLLENAEANNSDVVIFDYISGDSNSEHPKTHQQSKFLSEYVNKPFDKSIMGFLGYKYTPPTAWSKLYRTDLIKDKIQFCEGLIFEDNPFWAEVYLSAKKITYVPMPLYYYLLNRSGCIMQSLGNDVFDIFKIHEHIEKTFKNHNLYEKYKSEINLIKIMDYIRNYFRIDDKLKKDFYNKICSTDIETKYTDWLTGNYLDIEKTFVKIYKTMKELNFEDFQKFQIEELK